MKRSIIADIKKEQVRRLAAEGKRGDGRNFTDFRELEVKANPIGTAEGSARVKLGKTELIVGVKMHPGTPYPDKVDQGVLITGNELKPMAHQNFDGGQPTPEAIEIARVVDRGIRESNMIDMSDLCITPGEKVWMLFLDIQMLNYDGNAFDAATIGSLVALHSTTVPAKRYGLGEDKKLPINGWPLTVTSVKIDGHILVDPTFTEEEVAETRLTVSIDEKGDIRAMQKGLSGALTYDEIARTLDVTTGIASAIRQGLPGYNKGD